MNKADKIAALLELQRMFQKGKEDSAKVLKGGAWQIPVAEKNVSWQGLTVGPGCSEVGQGRPLKSHS